MKKLSNFIILFTFIFILLYLFNYNDYISKQVINSYNIWLYKVLPILFPIFILNEYIKNSNIPYLFEKYFHIPFIYIYSIIFGSPSSQYLIRDYDDITKYLSLTNYPSLLFTYYYLNKIFGSNIAILIIVANIITMLLLSFLLKPKKCSFKYGKNKVYLANAISNSINLNISILGTIVFYNILPFGLIKNIYLKSILLSILEITTSFNNIIIINVSFFLYLILSLLTLSTCGLCIQTQVFTIIPLKKIEIKKYLIYKVFHFFILLSIILLFLFLFY